MSRYSLNKQWRKRLRERKLRWRDYCKELSLPTKLFINDDFIDQFTEEIEKSGIFRRIVKAPLKDINYYVMQEGRGFLFVNNLSDIHLLRYYGVPACNREKLLSPEIYTRKKIIVSYRTGWEDYITSNESLFDNWDRIKDWWIRPNPRQGLISLPFKYFNYGDYDFVYYVVLYKFLEWLADTIDSQKHTFFGRPWEKEGDIIWILILDDTDQTKINYIQSWPYYVEEGWHFSDIYKLFCVPFDEKYQKLYPIPVKYLGDEFLKHEE